jgi:hypothetical protein
MYVDVMSQYHWNFSFAFNPTLSEKDVLLIECSLKSILAVAQENIQLKWAG